MRTSSKGINLIKKFEGCRLKAYKCPAGVWTIGWGHTAGVKEGQNITQDEADRYLVEDLKVFEKYVTNLKLPLNQNQFDALVSFTYNCGSGNLKTLVKNRSLQQIADALLLYNKSAGVTLNGLVRRRTEERELFLKQDNSKRYKVTAIALNVRTGPGTNYKRIKLLYLNEIIEIALIQDDWGLLANDDLGWVSMKYLKKI